MLQRNRFLGARQHKYVLFLVIRLLYMILRVTAVRISPGISLYQVLHEIEGA